MKSLSRVRLFATPRTAAYQAPPSMGSSRQEYWSGLPFPHYYMSKRHCCCCVTSVCPTLCDPIHSSPLGSSVPGILQARTLEWVAISFSNAWKWKKVKLLSRDRLLATPWTVAYQAPPSMGFSRQDYWSGLPLPSLQKSIKITLFHFSVICLCTGKALICSQQTLGTCMWS